MKTLVVYKSEKGSTKQYAEWIHEEISNSDLFSIDHFSASHIGEYDKVIIGSCIYAGQMPGLNFLVKNWPKLQFKKVFFFSVGLLPPDAPDSKKMYQAIPAEIRDNIDYEKLPGRMSDGGPNFLQRFIFKTLFKVDPNLNIDRNAIKPIVDFANS